MCCVSPAELHEGDVQVPVEELWQGAEYCRWHSETHPHHPPGVRHRWSVYTPEIKSTRSLKNGSAAHILPLVDDLQVISIVICPSDTG